MRRRPWSPGRSEGEATLAYPLRRLPEPRAAVAFSGAVSFLLLTVLAFVAWGTYRVHSAEAEIDLLQREVRRLVSLDGEMTRSVGLMALQGDDEWEARYRSLAAEFEREIDSVLERSRWVEGSASAQRLAEVERRMIAIEREALDLAARGERLDALRLLSGAEYLELKDAASAAMREIELAGIALQHRYNDAVRRFILVGGAGGVAVLLVLALVWLRVLRLLRRYVRERDQAEQALSSSEAELSALVRSMDDLVLVLDADGRYVNVAPTADRISRSAEGALGKRLHDYLPSETADRFLHHIRRALATGETQHIEYDVTLGCETIWRSASVSPMPENRVVWVARDITERKRAEERSRAQHAYLRAVIDASPSLIFAKDGEGRFTLANRAVAEVYGTTPGGILGKKDTDFNPDLQQVEDFLAADRKVIDSGEDLWIAEEWVTSARTGEARCFQTRKVRLEPPDGGPPQVLGVATDISERKRVEEALRETLQRLRSHFEQTLLGIVEFDLDGSVRSWNPAAERIFGYPSEEALGIHWSRFTPAAVLPTVESALRRVVETGQAQRSVNENLTRDGEVRICEWHNTPLLDATGAVIGIAGLVQDITDRVRVENALRDSEEKFHQLASSLREVFWIASADAREIHYVSPAYEEITGRTLQSVYERGEFLWSSIDPDDLERVEQTRRKVSAGEAGEIEFRHRHVDGSLRWVRVRAFPVLNAQGKQHRVVGIAEDVTERRRAERERLAAEAHYQRLVETSPESIYVLDPGGLVTEANQALAMLLERPREEVLGRHFSEFIAPEDIGVARDVFDALMVAGAGRFNLVIHLARPSGERRLVSVSAAAISTDDAAAGVHGIIHDITEERAHQEQMRLLAAALEGLDEGVFVRSIDGEIVYSNAMLHRLLGVDAEEISGLRVSDFIVDPDEAEDAERIIRTVVQSGGWVGRFPARRRDTGEVFPIEAILGRIDQPHGDPLIFGIVRDVKEEVVRERYLRRAERLGSLGTLVRGVAHEINNPLHAIRNFADLMMQEERSEDDREALGYIRQEADRAARVVADMHHFARQAEDEQGDRSILNLNEAVREALKQHRYALRTQGIQLEEELADDLPPVRANQSDVKQVILSLLSNAEHAMEEIEGERRLLIRTHPCPVGAAVEVTDSGAGIPPHHLEKIFDPFWTTKAPGVGSGLGLSVSHSIVMDHGGEIRVDSLPGQGTTFVVTFPVHESHEFDWQERS